MEIPQQEVMFEPSYFVRSGREYIDCFLYSSSKLTAVDPRAFKKMRKEKRISMIIEPILEMSEEEREKLIDTFTTMVSEFEGFGNPQAKMLELAKEVEKMNKMAERLRRAQDAFENLLTERERIDVLRDVTIRVRNLLNAVFEYLREDVIDFKESFLKELVITRRIIYECIKLTEMAENDLIDSKTVQEALNKLAIISLCLLRLEASRRGKMDYDDLNRDLAYLTSLTKKKFFDAKIRSIRDVLALST
ncbi:MAG: hypothetical protein ACXADD_18380 [Candidatus Thorarchaeota archaeon]|jgi:hypothetical protein